MSLSQQTKGSVTFLLDYCSAGILFVFLGVGILSLSLFLTPSSLSFFFCLFWCLGGRSVVGIGQACGRADLDLSFYKWRNPCFEGQRGVSSWLPSQPCG